MGRTGRKTGSLHSIPVEGFSERFRSLLQATGTTYPVLAEALGINQSSICYWVSGRGMPAPSRLLEICRYFSVSPNYLLGWLHERKKASNGRFKA